MSQRLEARHLTIEEMSRGQRQAADLLTARIKDAVQRLDDLEKAHCGRQAMRAAQVVALDGDRGSGKTSLYLSLRDGELLDREVRNRLLWLQPIDLEPMASPTNLLAAVLDRIEARLLPGGADSYAESRCDGFGEDGLAGLRPGGSKQERAWESLRRLKGDIALAWDGNLEGRAATLDPDCYAAEILRAERIRRTLNCRLEKALSVLSRGASSDCGKSSRLFVLPVDDFDLAPEHAMPFLRLLRMVSVPQLFTVLLTDERVLADVAVWSRVGTLGGLLDGDRLAVLPANVERIHSRGRQLAEESLRKHLPPSHRSPRLEPWLVPEALSLVVPGKEDPLAQLLARTSLGSPARRPEGYDEVPSTLARFLWIAEEPDADHDRARGPVGDDPVERPYYAQGILRAQPRNLVDLHLLLSDANSDSGKGDDGVMLRNVVIPETRRALKEQYWLDVQGVQTLLASMHREPNGKWRLERDALDVLASTRRAIETASAVQSMSLEMRSHVEWRVGAAPTASLVEAEERERQRTGRTAALPRQYLPDSAGGWFVLLHDILEAFEDQGRVMGADLLDIIHWEQPLAANTLLLPSTAAGGAGGAQAGRRPFTGVIEWPMVRWRTFRRFDAFLGLWEQFLRDLTHAWPPYETEGGLDLATALACGWIACNSRALVEESPSRILPGDEVDQLPGTALAALEPVASSWVNMPQRLPEHTQAYRWLVESLGMLSPEMGLSPDGVRLLLTPESWGTMLTEAWTARSPQDLDGATTDARIPSIARRVRAFRTLTLARVLEVGDVELALRLGFERPEARTNAAAGRLTHLDEEAQVHPLNSLVKGAFRPVWSDLSWQARTMAGERLATLGAALPGEGGEMAEEREPPEPEAEA